MYFLKYDGIDCGIDDVNDDAKHDLIQIFLMRVIRGEEKNEREKKSKKVNAVHQDVP